MAGTFVAVPWEKSHTVYPAGTPLSFVFPPIPRFKSAAKWTEVTFNSTKFDVCNCGDSYELTVLGKQFEGQSREAAFTNIKNTLIDSACNFSNNR